VVDVPMEKVAALTSAAEAGDVERVAELLAEGVPVDAQNEQHRTALNSAILADVITSELAARRDVASLQTGGTPDRVTADRVAVVRVLLSAGADPGQRVGKYCEDYPLRFVAARGRRDMAAALLEGGARPEGDPDWRGSPVLMAASQGHTEIVGMLLDRGVDIDGDDPSRVSPLCAAASGGRLETVRYLLQRGARPLPEAVAMAENSLVTARSHPDNDYAATPERWAEFAQVISTLKEALAGTPEADE
jgi:ankyrin repeat protein